MNFGPLSPGRMESLLTTAIDLMMISRYDEGAVWLGKRGCKMLYYDKRNFHAIKAALYYFLIML